MENEKIVDLEKKLKSNKVLYIVSISISALAIVLSIVALSGHFVGRRSNRHMMRNGGIRQERMMMGKMNDGFNRGGKFFMQTNGSRKGNNKFSSNNQMNSNKNNDRNNNQFNRSNVNTNENSNRFRRNNNNSSSNNNNVPRNNETPNVERNNQPVAPSINNQIAPQ